MDKFQNKYRIPSARLQNWDYRWSGAYFITICTKDRLHYFGEILETGHALSLKNNNDLINNETGHALSLQNETKMQLSHIGIIADLLWHQIPYHHTKNIELGEFIVMPNHIHGIIIIHDENVETGHALSNENFTLLPNLEKGHALSNENPIPLPDLEKGHALSNENFTLLPDLEKGHALSLQKQTNENQLLGKNRFQNIGKNSLSSIIGSYKSAVTKHARRLGFEFEWQTSFHDHIIRDEASFEKISNYILNNPALWREDKFYN